MNQPLKGKTALVTGASRGIGRAIAERLARDGATVALTYNAGKSEADAAVAAIAAAGGTAFAIQTNLVDPASVPALFATLDDELTRRAGSKTLDILVNNAGIAGYVGFKDATPDSWDSLVAVYLRAPFFIVQAARDRLADGASIINISSAAATKPVTAAPIYSMTKAAINIAYLEIKRRHDIDAGIVASTLQLADDEGACDVVRDLVPVGGIVRARVSWPRVELGKTICFRR